MHIYGSVASEQIGEGLGAGIEPTHKVKEVGNLRRSRERCAISNVPRYG